MKKISQLFLFFYGLLNHVFSQDSSVVKQIQQDFFIFDKAIGEQLIKKDTTQHQLQNYFERSRIGAIGFPNRHLLLQHYEEHLGANWFSSYYDKNLTFYNSATYVETPKVNTAVFAATGSKKEQVLKLKHVQKFGNDLNVNFRLNRITADNFYQYQKSFVNNVLVSLHSVHPKKRIGFKTNLSFDRFKHSENGGVKNDSSILQNSLINKNLVPVQLSNAKRDYRIISGEGYIIYRLTKDSMSYKGQYLSLGAKGSITKSEFFDNPAGGFYDTTYLNTLSTHDSVRFSKFTPGFTYNYVNKQAALSIGNQYDISRFANMDTSIVYQSQITSQTFAIALIQNKLILKEKFDYIWNGFNQGNYKFKLMTRYFLNFLDSRIDIDFISEKRSPDLFYNYNKSNYFIWKNNFSPTQSTHLNVLLKSEKIHTDIRMVYAQQNNLIYINELFHPEQIKKSISALRISVSNCFKVYKFYFTNTIHLQNQNHIAYALPKWYTQHQLYFQQVIKKNGMIFQMGAQAEIIDDIRSIYYEPSLNTFSMSERDKGLKKIYFIDLFSNLQFKELTFFLKTEHINQGTNGANFILMQNYYQRDRAVRFGLRWNFWD